MDPPFDLIAFEAINFMDGKRTAGEIAALLSLEFNRDFDAAWMERLVGILEGVKVVKAGVGFWKTLPRIYTDHTDKPALLAPLVHHPSGH